MVIHCAYRLQDHWVFFREGSKDFVLDLVDLPHENGNGNDDVLEFSALNLGCIYRNNYTFLQYDVTSPGKYGGGGEYIVQEGFGWTNGGMLRLLELFPKELTGTEDNEAAPGA